MKNVPVRFGLTIALAFVWSLIPASVNAQPIVIDDFSDDQSLIFAVGVGATTSSTAPGGMLGGERDLAATVTAGAVVSTEVTTGTLFTSVAAGSTGDVFVQWDGPDGLGDPGDVDPLGLGGLDLSVGGTQNALLVQIGPTDAPATTEITVYTDGANFSTFTAPIIVLPAPVDAVIPFSSFSVGGGAGADFSNIGAITARISGTVLDAEITLVQTTSTLTATMTDALIIDNDFDGMVGETDTLRYTVTIENPADALLFDSDSVTFTLTPDVNTALTVGSVTTSQGMVSSGNTAGDTTIALDIGTIADGGVVTITFDVTVNTGLPAGLTQLSAQGTVLTGTLSMATDDPGDMTSGADPTVTPVVHCGDGTTMAPETCDDAGESAMCDLDCTAVVCGDGTTNMTAGEMCDDAGESALCNADCTTALCGDGVTNTTAGEVCDDAGESVTCDLDCTTTACGDGTTNMTAGEVCDDAGESATCNADCTMALCGDGVLNITAGEVCDDGNTNDGDGCSADCSMAASCGDGNVDTGEECDDAGESATCDIDCTFQMCGDGLVNATALEECDDSGESAACDADCTTATCGDGTLNTTAMEVCDDGGESATCDLDCTPAMCGDGTINATAMETCDDSGESATCNANCTTAMCGDGTINVTAMEVCDDAGESAACDVDCTPSMCGDGTTNMTAMEACDDAGESATCNADCSAALCGDGQINVTAGETCDDSGESATCDDDCTEVVCGDGNANETVGEVCDDGGASETCDPNCTFATCGDGFVNHVAGEACDDVGESATCDSDCSAASCGDGTLNTTAGEICDDGGESVNCNPDCTAPMCGDGYTNTNAGEQCDDAGESETCDADCTPVGCGDGTQNATAGEACDDAGESETCNADCTAAMCGDGQINNSAGEVCDDGGESEACDSDCTAPSCGDGVLNTTAGEACDDVGDSATCNANCTIAECGDGILNTEAGELCDDGNNDPNDPCLPTCQFNTGEVLGGGGCAATGSDHTGVWFALIVLLGLMARRRRRSGHAVARGALIATVALGVGLGIGPQTDVKDAYAQDAMDRNFSAERFQLSSDRDGILGVESATVIGHLNFEAGLWFGLADDPLAIYRVMDDDRERTEPFLSRRIGGELVGAIGFKDRFQLGVQLPLILNQDYAYDGNDTLAPSSTAGVGDLRLTPKIVVVSSKNGPLDIALVPEITLPTANDDSYLGDSAFTISPQLAIGRAFGAIRLLGNVGYHSGQNSNSTGLDVTDEWRFRLGAGYTIGAGGAHPIEVALALALATATGDADNTFNQNHSELLAGGNYQINRSWNAFAGAGVGLTAGYGTPDWRAVAGVRFARRNYDSDKDGMLDRNDTCPEKPEDKDGFEDDDGCPDDDNDKDGIVDAKDGAPNKAEDKDGFEDDDGVPDLDNDGDNIADTSDTCPMKPETVNKYQDEDGCPDEIPDSDQDGMNDLSDACPQKAEDKDGFEDQDGCPEDDNDKDGLLDGDDSCPLKAGPKENKGCPDTDRDGDKVVDRLDNCPDEAGTPENQGCKKKQLVQLSSTKIEILQKVYFTTGNATIQYRSFALLRNVADVLKAHPEIAMVRIEGHTDNRGAEAKNLNLSQRRAESVKKFLVKNGVAAERLDAKGFGESKPIDVNTTLAGRAKNRRVDFQVVQQ